MHSILVVGTADASRELVLLVALGLLVVMFVIGALLYSAIAHIEVTPETASALNEASRRLDNLIRNHGETIDQLDHIVLRIKLLDKYGSIASGFLTGLGVAVAIVATASVDWITKGRGWWLSSSAWDKMALVRGLQIGLIALGVSLLLMKVGGCYINHLKDKDLKSGTTSIR